MSSPPLSVQLVKSLFCGLPNKDSRVCVVLSASDETYKDKFLYAGLLAPVKYWDTIFARQWERRVLSGTPRIEFLHMTEIRSREWREGVGLSDTDAEKRVDNAVQILSKRRDPSWISFDFDHAHFNTTLKQKIRIPTGAVKTFLAEHFGFLGYVYTVLQFVKKMYPHATKVDFLVEKNGEITRHLPFFYENFEPFLREIGAVQQIGMLGDIIPGGKDRSPLQAADVLCWHLRRARENTLAGIDLDRYKRIARKNSTVGFLSEDALTQLQSNLRIENVPK